MHLVGDAELFREVAVVNLDVARFVSDLIRSVVLCFRPRHDLDDLCRRDERTFLCYYNALALATLPSGHEPGGRTPDALDAAVLKIQPVHQLPGLVHVE